MSTSFNTQITKKPRRTTYSIQFSTNDFESYKLVEEACRRSVDKESHPGSNEKEPYDIHTPVESPRKCTIKFQSHKIDNRGKSGKWLINCDGYYPYCSLCGYEPEWTGKDNRMETCPRCKATMSKDDFDENNYTTIKAKNFSSKWIVIVDNQSAKYICPNCKFEHVEADPRAQIEWQGCPQCLTPLKVPDVRTRLLNNIYDK